MHNGRLRDAKRFVTNGPEPCWHGRKEDPKSKDVGVAVSCLLQVRSSYPWKISCSSEYIAGSVRMRRKSSALRVAIPHFFARLSLYHPPPPLQMHLLCKYT
jgi:hypothetical protein